MKIIRLMKLLADENRLRTLMLLTRAELCVCQIMAVLGVSQPLVSRNLALLSEAGLLEETRKGKLVFYKVRRDLPRPAKRIIRIMREELAGDDVLTRDLSTLGDCLEYQEKAGRCDMKTFLEFMETRKKMRRSP
jgi:ArsR family transcriptional regulator